MSGLALPANLGPMARITADDQGRYSMNGVQVRDPGDGTFSCVGTDGRYLLIARGISPGDDRGHLGCPPDADVIVPSAAWNEAFRKPPQLLDQPRWSKQPKTIQVSKEGRKIRLSGHERSLTTDEMDGARFPDWRQILPKRGPAFTIYVNPDYLAELLKTVKSMLGDEDQKVLLAFWSDTEPLAVVAKDRLTGLCLDGLLMPLTPSPSQEAKDKAERAKEREEEEEKEPWYSCDKCGWRGPNSDIVAAKDVCPKCGADDFTELDEPETLRCTACDFKGFYQEFVEAADNAGGRKCPKCSSEAVEVYEGSPKAEEEAKDGAVA
jgi:Zn finger protein HypA/HybF involved in hydrogenase expression